MDDSKDLRAYLSSILKPYVGQVIEAADGEIGLAKARQYKPSLILSDWNMPKMSGFELLQAVKSDEELKWTPVILLTARAGEGERVEGLLTGAEVSTLTKNEEDRTDTPLATGLHDQTIPKPRTGSQGITTGPARQASENPGRSLCDEAGRG